MLEYLGQSVSPWEVESEPKIEENRALDSHENLGKISSGG